MTTEQNNDGASQLSSEVELLQARVEYLEARLVKAGEEEAALAAQAARLRGLGQLVREAATDMANIGTEELFDRAEKWDDALKEMPMASLDQHPDDAAVDRFARTMKLKLAAAREKGRDGWDDPDRCSVELLADLLMEHLQKANRGNYVDIANLAMMLHLRLASSELLARELSRRDADKKAEGALAIRHLTKGDDWEDDELRMVIDDYVAGLRRQAEEPRP
ncbi:hypothetical protein [Billgrantia bachuensis]|uniref:Uncharacterized protein n=1 Tax=Billgrantia bachuensis TaxID=2717286 RepID=A0ABX0PPL4_9GAMM|nr:hypothetical protein [Halomonas bachuensis]NIC05226.1 hypothetical protein [Halomonas bachuensis]